ncbi:DUF2642 domain-containing protein [Ornithinibacillus gellani]|uniref:DUF2642 domain-containing protein n=1 Tax=Ornithinibacillus gellani TaxID=2293253 RepID=UPI000F4A7996|nr:DUF2642 domain-containing protein [Ornithinibacillus gellani]TQS70972.1 DUF2642 domain-containing protein [Ornithinibacillus gellani]
MSKSYKGSKYDSHGRSLMMDKWGSKHDNNLDSDRCGSRYNNDSCDKRRPPSLECPPNSPTTIREILCNLTGEQIQVTTPFGPVTGTLIAVKRDYIVMIDETTGEQVHVRIEKIALVNPLRGGI